LSTRMIEFMMVAAMILGIIWLYIPRGDDERDPGQGREE